MDIPIDDDEDSNPEEIANAATHGIGVLLSLIGIPLLILQARHYSTPLMVAGVSIFGFGLLMVYLSSTLYHLARQPITKWRLRIWDHVSIFFLIAGTHTPIILKFIPPQTAHIFLAVMWSFVIIGSLMKIFYTGRMKIFFIVLYLALGWMALFIIRPLVAAMPVEVFWWILGGGLAYTLGVAFYVRKGLKYHHAIWHCFVIAGTLAHFIAIYISLPLQVHL